MVYVGTELTLESVAHAAIGAQTVKKSRDRMHFFKSIDSIKRDSRGLSH
jgi:hypothetical protein